MFQCIYDLAARQGVFQSINPEQGKMVVHGVISNLQNRLVKINVNQIRSVLENLNIIRHKISDEVWNAPLPGNGSVPFDYHQQRREQFLNLIKDTATLEKLDMIPALINLLVEDIHNMQQMVHPNARHKVIIVLNCIIIGITSYSNVVGGHKKTIRRKTRKNKKRKRKSMRYKKRI